MHNKPTPSSERLLYPFRSLPIALWYANNRVDEQFFPILKGNGNASKRVYVRAVEPGETHGCLLCRIPHLHEATT